MGVACCKEKPKSDLRAVGYLGWREAALLSVDSKISVYAASRDPLADHVVQKAGDIGNRVQDFLASDDVLSKPGFTPEGVELLKQKDSDWRGFTQWLLNRIRSVNDLGGPRVMLVSWKTLRNLGRFPMYPMESEHILDAERLLKEYARVQDEKGKVDGRVICFSFFSHRWERPSWEGDAHPDTEDHKKAKALAMFGEFGTCPIFAPHHDFDYYFWVDYCSIDQVNPSPKELGVTKLCAYVAACIQMIMYDSETAEYEPRAWTRLERMMGYTLCACPLFKYLDDSYPSKPIEVDDIVSKRPETYAKSEDGKLLLRIRDPNGQDACYTSEEDLPIVRQLSGTVQDAMPINPARTWHNVTELVYDECHIPLDTEHYGMDVAKHVSKI